MMTEHERETAFLREIILYDDTAGRCELERKIGELQRDERCLRRATWLIAVLAALAGVSLGYGAILQENFPYRGLPLVNYVIGGFGVASSICFLSFVGLMMVYRKKLNRLREECRRLILTHLESRLGKPHARAFQNRRLGVGDPEPVAILGVAAK
jgi:hypothetical protein